MKLRKLFALLPLFACLLGGCVKNNGLGSKVDEAVTGVKADEKNVELRLGGPVKVIVAELVTSGEPKSNELTIAVSDASVCKANKETMLSGESFQVEALKLGETNIIITSASDTRRKATVAVKVVEAPAVIPVTGVELSKSSAELKVGEQVQLVETVLPENATNFLVDWSVENTDVLSCDGGLVTAKKSGSSKVTVATKDGGFTATAQITVLGNEPTELVEGSYYIVGTFTGGSWSSIRPQDVLTLNPDPNHPTELMIQFDATKGNMLKVVQYYAAGWNWFNPDATSGGSDQTTGTEYAKISETNMEIVNGSHFTLYFDYSYSHYWIVNTPMTGGNN